MAELSSSARVPGGACMVPVLNFTLLKVGTKDIRAVAQEGAALLLNSAYEDSNVRQSGRWSCPLCCSPNSAASCSIDDRPLEDIGDVQKERSRVYRRTVFNFRDWRKHRRSSRYRRHIYTLLLSRIVRALLLPVLAVVGVTLAVGTYNTLHYLEILPLWAPTLPTIPMEPFQLTSFALSLLLVFRTNTSYSRWHEARCKIGVIVTTSKDLARQAMAFFGSDTAAKQMFVQWLIAFGRISRSQLREDGDLRSCLRNLLHSKEIDKLTKSASPSSYCLQALSYTIVSSAASEQAIARMDENVTALQDAIACCERIITTPIPLSYTRHTTRFLTIWMFLLPFALWQKCKWTMVPIAALVAYMLLGIEEIGVQIEEPFGMLAMEAIFDSSEAQLRSLLSDCQDVSTMILQPSPILAS